MAAKVLKLSSVCTFFVSFSCFLFLKHDQFYQGWTAEHLTGHTLNLLPDFDDSDVLLDIVVGGAAVLFRRFSTCRLGKRAGSLVKLRQRRFRSTLPSIHLANLPLSTQQNGLLLLSQTNNDVQTLLLCVSQKLGWMMPFLTARYICRIFSCLERIATQNYSGKLRNKFSSSDSASVWKGLKEITNYKTPSPSTVENQQLADDLNEFYCRFEKTPFTSPATPLSPLLQCRSVKTRCARSSERTREGRHLGRDGVTPACLKTSWPRSSHRSSTDHWSLVSKSPHASNAPPSSLFQRNPK